MNDIIATLRRLGITPLYKGYRQLAYLLSIALSDYAPGCPVAQELYEKTAAHFSCHYGAVERNVRTLAKRAWKVDPSYLCEIAGYRLERAPSSAQFIGILYSYILYSSQQDT